MSLDSDLLYWKIFDFLWPTLPPRCGHLCFDRTQGDLRLSVCDAFTYFDIMEHALPLRAISRAACVSSMDLGVDDEELDFHASAHHILRHELRTLILAVVCQSWSDLFEIAD